MPTSTVSAPFLAAWARYEAACDDLEVARRTAAEARALANEDRRTMKEIEGRHVSEGVEGPNKETRDARLKELLAADADYQHAAGSLANHEQGALDAEIAAEGHSFWLRGALRFLDHINATHGVERGI